MSTQQTQKRLSVYIDRFNLYHAVAQMNDQSLKWLNFWSLGESFVKPDEKIERVYFFTAVLKWNRDKQIRHRNFIEAQKANGVRVVESKFRKASRFCYAKDGYCKNYEEKQTDVAIAVTLLEDAIKGRVDRAILITADSDQVPLVNTFKRLFPDKTVTLSAPPNRSQMARELGSVVDDRNPLTRGRLLAHRMPRDVFDADGNKVASMPALYLQ